MLGNFNFQSGATLRCIRYTYVKYITISTTFNLVFWHVSNIDKYLFKSAFIRNCSIASSHMSKISKVLDAIIMADPAMRISPVAAVIRLHREATVGLMPPVDDVRTIIPYSINMSDSITREASNWTHAHIFARDVTKLTKYICFRRRDFVEN